MGLEATMIVYVKADEEKAFDYLLIGAPASTTAKALEMATTFLHDGTLKLMR